MAGFKSTYLSNLYLNALLNAAAFDATIPADLYFQAYTAAPTPAGGGTQWSDAGISRVTKTCNTTNWPTATAASITTGTTMAFGTPVADAIIVGIGIFDASTSGNFLAYFEFDAPVPATASVAFTLPIGSLIGTEA